MGTPNLTTPILPLLKMLGVSLFLVLMAAGAIQGQTMKGQQRTRNFFPIQVDSESWSPDPLIPSMTCDSFVHCAMHCKGVGDLPGTWKLPNEYVIKTHNLGAQTSSCDSFTYDASTGLCQFGGLLLPPVLPAGNLKVWGVRQPWPPALEVSSSDFVAENFPEYLGTYNMTGKSPVEIKIYGNSRPHWKEYPIYENAEGYQIHPDKTFDHRNGLWNYYWKIGPNVQPSLLLPSYESDLMWDITSWTHKTSNDEATDPSMRVRPVY